MSNLIKNIITSTLLFLVAIGGYFVSIDTGTLKVNQSYADRWGDNSGANAPTTPTALTPKNSDEQNKWLNEAIQAVNAIL
jgi:hypothetical protein